jgi:DNA-binding transcriptional LysR family regulator
MMPGMPRLLDLDALRAFLAVAELGSFTRAALALNLTQSGVSMRIRRLEQAEDLHLFDRQPPALRLTPQGAALLPHAERLLRLEAAARVALRGASPVVTVRLGAMEDYATRILPPLLSAFRATAPEIMVAVETGLTQRMLPQLGQRHDLLLAMHRGGAGGEGVTLQRSRPVWAAAADFRLPGTVPLALHAEGCLFREWAIAALERAGRRWRPAYAALSQAAVEAAVAGGIGCTPVREATMAPGLRVLEGLPPLPPSEIRLHVAPRPGSAARRLADFLKERLAA